MTVHFICRGNALRSLIADCYLRSKNLKNISVISSGTLANDHRAENVQLFHETLKVLKNHGLAQYSKQSSDQLTKQRLDKGDVTICMNEVVSREVLVIGPLPQHTLQWDIVDIGEGDRIIHNPNDLRSYVEAVYDDIVKAVDQFVSEANLA